MARRTRLDAELVRRGLARSREQAVALIEAGRVEVRGTAARKAAAMVDPADPVRVREGGTAHYAARGGDKLGGWWGGFGPGGVGGGGPPRRIPGRVTGGVLDVE